MSVRALLIGSAVLATVAIILSATVVLMPPRAASQAPNISSTAAIDAGDPALSMADPRASGVIAVRNLATGVVGRLTPDGRRLGIDQQDYVRTGLSSDGSLSAGSDCSQGGDRCRLLILPAEGQYAEPDDYAIELRAPFLAGEWAPDTASFAAMDIEHALYFVDPESGSARLLAPAVTAYAWAEAGRLVFAAENGTGFATWRVSAGADAELLSTTAAPVRQLFPSPDLASFAFAQDDPGGWRLLTVNSTDGQVVDFGHLGAGPSRIEAEAPAFSIAWSPDQRYLAVGPVTNVGGPSFIRERNAYPVILLTPGAPDSVRRYHFDTGYAGELKWSGDSSRLAVSTYAPNRVWHEVYMLDMASLDQAPRYLLDGCEIVWSPDGEFVAVKREPAHATAVAVIRVETGAYWHVADQLHLVPVAWGTSEEEAMRLAQQPVRRSAQLGK
jgi:hypothetical protein